MGRIIKLIKKATIMLVLISVIATTIPMEALAFDVVADFPGTQDNDAFLVFCLCDNTGTILTNGNIFLSDGTVITMENFFYSKRLPKKNVEALLNKPIKIVCPGYADRCFSNYEEMVADEKEKLGTNWKWGDYGCKVVLESVIREVKSVKIYRESEYESNAVEALNDTYYYNKSITTCKKVFFNVTISNAQSGEHFFIEQGSKVIDGGEIGKFNAGIKIDDEFDLSKPIFIRADGCASVPININLFSSEAKGSSISFGDGIKFSIPQDVKFLGGTKMNFGIKNLIPVEYSVDEKKGTWKAAVGFTLVGVDKKKDKDAKVKTIVDDVKNFFGQTEKIVGDAKKFYKQFSSLKETIADMKSDYAFSLDTKLIGFVEGNFDRNGKAVVTNSGGIFIGNLGVDFEYPFSAGPVPCFFEASFEAEVAAKLNFYRASGISEELIPTCSIDGEISVSAGLGIGIKKAASLSGGFKGTFSANYDIRKKGNNYLCLKAKLEAYWKLRILFFKASNKYKLAEKTVYETDDSEAAYGFIDNNTSEIEVTGELPNNYDNSKYVIDDYSYLDEVPEDEGVAAKFEGISNTTEIKNNVFRETCVDYAELSDGRRIIVFVNSKDSDPNNMAVYYSVFDQGKWSEPAQVDAADGARHEDMPKLCSNGNDVWLVWMNANKTFDISGSDTTMDPENTSLTVDEVAKYYDICVAKFENNKFTLKNRFHTDGVNTAPVITMSDDGKRISVAWINRKDGKMYGASGYDSIYAVTGTNYTIGSISSPELLESFSNGVISSIAIDDNGKDSIDYAYSLCEGVDSETDTDIVHVYENGKRVSLLDYNQLNPQYFNHKLYYYSRNNILSPDAPSREGLIESEKFKLLDTDDGIVAVTYNHEGLASQLVLSDYRPELKTFAKGIPLTELTNDIYVGDFGAFYSQSNNRLDVAANYVKVVDDMQSDQPYGTAQICFSSFHDLPDIGIEYFTLTDKRIVYGRPLEFVTCLHNSGYDTISNVEVCVLDSENNQVYYKTFENLNIAPGEDYVIKDSLKVYNTDAASKLTAKVWILDEHDDRDGSGRGILNVTSTEDQDGNLTDEGEDAFTDEENSENGDTLSEIDETAESEIADSKAKAKNNDENTTVSENSADSEIIEEISYLSDYQVYDAVEDVETNLEDNIIDIDSVYNNVSMNAIEFNYTNEGKKVITAEVINDGDVDCDSVVLKVYRDDRLSDSVSDNDTDSDVKTQIGTFTLNNINAHTIVPIAFEVSEAKTNDIYYIEIDSLKSYDECGDDNSADDTCCVVVKDVYGDAERTVSLNDAMYRQDVEVAGKKFSFFVKPYSVDTDGFYEIKRNKVILKNPTRIGYTFKGWYIGDKKVKSFSVKQFDANNGALVEARWQENTYNIVFKSVPPAKGIKVTGKATTLKKVGFTEAVEIGLNLTAPGYELAGFSTKKNADKPEIVAGDIRSGLSGFTKKDKKLVLYPVWRAVE